MAAIAEVVAGVVKGIAAPVVGLFTKKVERKAARDAIHGSVELAKIDGKTQVAIQASDWEIVSKAQEQNTWKDEYVTLSVFAIFNVIVFGSILESLGFPGGAMAVDGVMMAVERLDALDGNVGTLMWMVAAAALSIKGVKEIFK